jgi:DNA polymerase-4
MDVMYDVTPSVERISIDEAFLDVAGATHLFGSPATIATALRRRVREEVGLPISVGVATTKHLAKVASQVAKPDGLVVVAPGTERDFLEPLPVALMWGVGPVAQKQLASEGIRTIGELARSSPRSVSRLVGEAAGAKLSALALNEDPRRVVTSHRARSIGAQSAMGRQQPTPELVRDVLSHLADRVASRMRAKHRSGRTVTVRVRFTGLRSVTRSLTLTQPVCTTLTLTEIAEQLAWQAIRDQPGDLPEISLLHISVSNLVVVTTVQAELPMDPDDPRRPGSTTGTSRLAVDESVDAVRKRFGRGAVGYLPVVLNRGHSVPDDFRELAERDL